MDSIISRIIRFPSVVKIQTNVFRKLIKKNKKKKKKKKIA